MPTSLNRVGVDIVDFLLIVAGQLAEVLGSRDLAMLAFDKGCMCGRLGQEMRLVRIRSTTPGVEEMWSSIDLSGVSRQKMQVVSEYHQ